MMKKIILSLACIAGLNSAAMAESTGFIGLELGYTSIQGDTLLMNNYDSSDISYGVRLGALNEEWRTMFLGTYVDSGEQSIQTGLISFDYLLSNPKDGGFIPYIGAHGGYASYESDFIQGDGYVYGGQVGVIVDLMPELSIDVNYRYSLGDADELNSYGTFVIALDYKF